jgi:response regulator RpfG family c-di-GMP phosphodiesterase
MSQSSETTSADKPQAFFHKPSLLVVDDDYDTCDMMCQFLSQEYQCDYAYNGEQALIKIKSKRYAVILADLMMPKVDGYAVVSNAAVLSPTTPVIVVSAVAEVQSAIKAMKMGAFDYIIKPFNPEQIEVSVKRALGHHILARTAHENEMQLVEYAAELERVNAALRKALKELESTYHATISALAATLESRNLETRSHSDRVVAYSLRLGREIQLDEEEMKRLKVGALFHDSGKIGVEDKILFKADALTKEEWQVMKTHVHMGEQIISKIPLLHSALPVVTQHHERWDGTGYPAGLSGEQIDIKARVFAVADAIDAITSNRPYDAPRTFEEVRNELVASAGKQFDPKIVEAFCRVPLEEWTSLVE